MKKAILIINAVGGAALIALGFLADSIEWPNPDYSLAITIISICLGVFILTFNVTWLDEPKNARARKKYWKPFKVD